MHGSRLRLADARSGEERAALGQKKPEKSPALSTTGGGFELKDHRPDSFSRHLERIRFFRCPIALPGLHGLHPQSPRFHVGETPPFSARVELRDPTVPAGLAFSWDSRGVLHFGISQNVARRVMLAFFMTDRMSVT